MEALDARVVSRAADDRASEALSSVDRYEWLRRMALEQDEMLRFPVPKIQRGRRVDEKLASSSYSEDQ